MRQGRHAAAVARAAVSLGTDATARQPAERPQPEHLPRTSRWPPRLYARARLPWARAAHEGPRLEIARCCDHQIGRIGRFGKYPRYTAQSNLNLGKNHSFRTAFSLLHHSQMLLPTLYTQ